MITAEIRQWNHPVHTNGRLYDPKLGRFLQADPIVQAPKNSQNLNRYSYVLNNPLSYTDPDGYFFKSLWKKVRPYVAIAVMVAGMIVAPELAPLWGGLSGFINSGTIKGAVIGAFSAAVFQGIGNAFAKLGQSVRNAGATAQNMLRAGKILAHGVAGGVMSELSGGKFGHGFWAAGFTQAFAPGINGIDVGNVGFSAQRTIAAAIVGGTASELSGGKFANGAMTGAFSRAFNDELHLRDKIQSAKEAISDNLGNVGTAALAELRLVGGVLQLAAGKGLCASVVGCALGAPLIAQGVGNVGGAASDYYNIFGNNSDWNFTGQMYSSASQHYFGADYGEETFLALDLITGVAGLIRPINVSVTFEGAPWIEGFKTVPAFRTQGPVIITHDAAQIAISARELGGD